jgi:hypothetical protein
VATDPRAASRRRFWQIVLLVLVVLPLLPEFVVLSVSTIANFSGCRVDAPPSSAAIDTAGGSDAGALVPPDPSAVARGFVPPSRSMVSSPSKVCPIGPMVSSIIRFALEAALLVGVSFGFGVVAVWLALCYVSITRGCSRVLSRLLLAFFISLIFAFVPYLGPMMMMSAGGLENPRCQPNEGGVGPCLMYGGDIGSVAHDSGVLFLHTFIGAPVALGAFGLYALVLLIAGIAGLSRRSRRLA